jgi:hypothetical protein
MKISKSTLIVNTDTAFCFCKHLGRIFSMQRIEELMRDMPQEFVITDFNSLS